MFVVGRSPDIGVQRAVANEARTHGDIMMVDIHETYNNLPLKALGMASLGLGSGRRGMRSRSRSVRSCHACARLPSLNIHDLLFSYTFTSRPCAFSVRRWLSMTPSSISKSTTTCTSSRTAGRRRCSSGGPRALATLGARVVRDLWCGGCVDGEGLCGWQRFEWVASGSRDGLGGYGGRQSAGPPCCSTPQNNARCANIGSKTILNNAHDWYYPLGHMLLHNRYHLYMAGGEAGRAACAHWGQGGLRAASQLLHTTQTTTHCPPHLSRHVRLERAVGGHGGRHTG